MGPSASRPNRRSGERDYDWRRPVAQFLGRPGGSVIPTDLFTGASHPQRQSPELRTNSRFHERSRWNSDRPRAPQHAAQLQFADQASISIARLPTMAMASRYHRTIQCPLFRQRGEAWRSDRNCSWLASIVYVRIRMTRCVMDNPFSENRCRTLAAGSWQALGNGTRLNDRRRQPSD